MLPCCLKRISSVAVSSFDTLPIRNSVRGVAGVADATSALPTPCRHSIRSPSITVTGTGASATHTTTLTLNVTAVTPPGGVVNGGFESGSLSGWSSSGVVAPKVVTTAHSGSYAAQLGVSTAYNGDSTLTQTVVIPSGNSSLTLWYQPHCPDTLTYDQITVQIRSTSGATLATPLNVCSNSGAWTQASFSLAAYAGQSVVLWFNDHDDGYPTDPTYFLLDDVSIG